MAKIERGGKVIMHHGWNDNLIMPQGTVQYYDRVKQTVSGSDEFSRLYMVPGMQHCSGGPGLDNFGEFGISQIKDPQHNIYMALENWVEKGEAPESVIASKAEGVGAAAKVTMARPLCAYPQVAKYKGNGDTNDAASFVCTAP